MLRYVLLLIFICCGFQQVKQKIVKLYILMFQLKNLEASINKILIGKSAVDQDYIHESQRDEYLKRNYDVIYFNVTISNINGGDDKYVNYDKFILEDEDGESYEPEQSKDPN